MGNTEAGNRNRIFVGLATVAAVASLFAYSCVLLGTFAALYQIGTHYGVSHGRLGYIQLYMMVGFFVSVFVAGRLSDKHGRLPVVLGGCVFMAAGALVIAAVNNFTLTLAGSAIMGMGGGMTEAIGMVLIGDLYSNSRRTSMMNLSQAVFGVGAILAPYAVGLLVRAHLSWRLAFVGIAVLCAMAAVPTVWAMLMRQEHIASEVRDKPRWRNVLSQRMVLWLALGLTLYVGAELGQSSWMSVYFAERLQSTKEMAAQSLSYMWLGILLGRLAAAWAARHIGDAAMIIGCLSLAGISQAGLLLAPGPHIALLPALTLGIFLGPVWPTIVSCAGVVCPEQAGTATAIVVAAGSLGAAIFPPAIGWLADQAGLWAALWLCVVILLANVALFTGIRKAIAGATSHG